VMPPPANAKWFVKGHVVEPASSSPLPGVTVSLTAPNSNPLVTVTNANGEYWIASNSAPSSFKIKAELAGFSPVTQSYGFGAPKGRLTDLFLQGAAVTEAITVTAAAPQADSSGESSMTNRRGASLAAPRDEALADRLLRSLATSEPLPED